MVIPTLIMVCIGFAGGLAMGWYVRAKVEVATESEPMAELRQLKSRQVLNAARIRELYVELAQMETKLATLRAAGIDTDRLPELAPIVDTRLASIIGVFEPQEDDESAAPPGEAAEFMSILPSDLADEHGTSMVFEGSSLDRPSAGADEPHGAEPASADSEISQIPEISDVPGAPEVPEPQAIEPGLPEPPGRELEVVETQAPEPEIGEPLVIERPEAPEPSIRGESPEGPAAGRLAKRVAEALASEARRSGDPAVPLASASDVSADTSTWEPAGPGEGDVAQPPVDDRPSAGREAAEEVAESTAESVGRSAATDEADEAAPVVTVEVGSPPPTHTGDAADETDEEPAPTERPPVSLSLIGEEVDEEPAPVEVDLRDADDLTAIRGIGPKLATILNEAGIFTYAQLAALDDAGIDELAERLGSFKSRIRRDDWVGSAHRLAGVSSLEIASR